MDTVRDKAIILKRASYGEADWRVSFLTQKEGKLSGWAKGGRRSRKRFASALETGLSVELVYEKRRQGIYLREARGHGGFPSWRRGLLPMGAALYALELADRSLPEAAPSSGKYQCLETFLSSLSGTDRDGILPSLLVFQYRWLSLSGWEPRLAACGRCQKGWREAARWELGLEEGKILCENCGGDPRKMIDRSWIALFLDGEKPSCPIDRKEVQWIQSLFERHWAGLLGRPLAVAGWLRENYE